ncbi:MAG: tail fiber protein [bacterium]|nr:tail fiber protein [bacterium]
MKKIICFLLVLGFVFTGCEAGINSNSSGSGGSDSDFSFSDMYSKIKTLTEALQSLEGTQSTSANSLESRLAKLEAGGSNVPVGTIVPFGGVSSTIPSGWLLCDGRAIDRVSYDTLFAVVQVNWGSGDGSFTFNLPDLRGVVLRGANQGRVDGYADPDFAGRVFLNGGSNNSVDEKIGTFQMDEFMKHTHSYDRHAGLRYNTGNNSDGRVLCIYSIERATSSAGGNESRGKNAAVHYIIKYQ